MKLFVVIVILLFSFSCFAQEEKKIRIIQANSLEFDQYKKDAQQLIGNVIFEHDSAYMYCDTALLYTKNNSFEAFSNVRIVQGDSIKIIADSVIYTGKSKVAKLKGNVVYTDNDLKLVTSQLDYNMQEKIGYYTSKAIITSQENNNTLISQKGTYFSNSQTLFFKDSVKLTNPKYVIESDTLIYNTESEIAYLHGETTITSDSNFIFSNHGWYDTKKEKSSFWDDSYILTSGQKLMGDSLFYDRDMGLGEAFGNVLIQDTANKTDLVGGYGFYDEANDSSFVTDCPIFIQYFDDDTLYLISDTLNIKQDTATDLKTVRAYHNVRLYKSDFQANCDSLVYTESDSIMRFIDEPIIWSDENQLSGKAINLKTYEGTIERLFINYRATIISLADTAQLHYNQIQGKKIEGVFDKNNALQTVYINGNGELLYFIGQEESPITDVNHTKCADMKVTLKDNELNNINFYVKPTAFLKPIVDLKKSEEKLSNFNWNIELRPISFEDLID